MKKQAKKYSVLKEKNQRYFDRWAQNYDNFIFGWWMRYIQRKLVGSLELQSKMKVLDVGCGTGYLLLQLSKNIKKGKIVGVDISLEMIKQTNLKIHNQKNIQLLQAGAEKLPFHPNTFDYVLSSEAFHHFPDPRKALAEMKRVIKKEGKIVIADISIPPHLLFNVLFKIEPGFVKIYGKKEMIELAQKAGLEAMQQKRIGLFALIHTFSAPLKPVSRKINK